MAKNSPYNRQPTNLALAIYSLFMSLLALIVLPVYINLGEFQTNSYHLITGDVGKPFVYRALAPMLSRWLACWLPDVIIRAILDNPALGFAARQLGGPWAVGGAACLIVLYVSMLAALAGLLMILARYGYPRHWWAAPPVALAGLLLLFTPMAYIYDLPTWALWTWAIVALAYRHDDIYLVLFAIANSSKETSILLIPIWATVTWPDRRDSWPRLLAEQIVIAGVTRGVLMLAYWDKPGTAMQWHIIDQISRPDMLALVGGIMVITAIAIGWGWKNKPILLRRALLASAPTLLALYLIWGMPGEIRVFLELTPIVVPLMIWRSDECHLD